MEATDIKLKAGDNIRNSVGILLLVKEVDDEKQIAYLVNLHNETNPYQISRVVENIMTGKWSYHPLKKYANWI